MKKKRWSFWKKKKQRNGNRINQDRYGVSVPFSWQGFVSERKQISLMADEKSPVSQSHSEIWISVQNSYDYNIL